MLAADNSANISSFSSDGQFVMIGNNGGTIANNTGNTEHSAGLNIADRINREWKITNTDFTGTFSLDITPSGGTYDAAKLRLLVDDDGDFSNGGTSVQTPSIAYSGGVITVGSITTSMIPAGSTRYITLATVAAPGAVSPNLTLWLKADAGITQTGGAISQWNDQSSNAVHVSQPTPAAQPVLTTDTINYYPVPAFDNSGSDMLENTNIAYNRIMNVTGGTSDATTGSLFTVAKVKSLTADNRMVYQYNTGPTGSFIFRSSVDNTGNLRVGARGSSLGSHILPNFQPFIATGLETNGSNNALQLYRCKSFQRHFLLPA